MTGYCACGRTRHLIPERGGLMIPPVVEAIVAGAVAFDAFCLVSLVRHPARNVPKWGWALIICASSPWGGLAYLVFGREGKPLAPPEPPGPPPEPPGSPRERPVLAPRPVRRGPVTIEVDDLVRRFGPVTAVDGLSFTVRPGLETGFPGPDGAGESS